MTLEQLAIQEWREWAAWRKNGRCSACGAVRYVGRTAGGRAWLCLECWDLAGRKSAHRIPLEQGGS